MSQEDIIVSHRLGKRSDTGDWRRVVIVRFSKVTVRAGVIRARRRLRNIVVKTLTNIIKVINTEAKINNLR